MMQKDLVGGSHRLYWPLSQPIRPLRKQKEDQRRLLSTEILL